MKKIHHEITINASREKVWKTMLEQDTYMEWTKPFNPSEGGSSSVEGDWSKGSKMKFIGMDEKGAIGGMLSYIEENKPNEFLSIKHIGIILPDGKEDTESEQAKKWSPSFENYTFKDSGVGTQLLVDVDVDEQYLDFFNEAWPKALLKLKEISER